MHGWTFETFEFHNFWGTQKLLIWLMHAFMHKFPVDLHHWGVKLINGCCIGTKDLFSKK